jgi:hypothetical protein
MTQQVHRTLVTYVNDFDTTRMPNSTVAKAQKQPFTFRLLANFRFFRFPCSLYIMVHLLT